MQAAGEGAAPGLQIVEKQRTRRRENVGHQLIIKPGVVVVGDERGRPAQQREVLGGRAAHVPGPLRAQAGADDKLAVADQHGRVFGDGVRSAEAAPGRNAQHGVFGRVELHVQPGRDLQAEQVVVVGAKAGHHGQVARVLVGIFGKSAGHQLTAVAVFAAVPLGGGFGGIGPAIGKKLPKIINQKAGAQPVDVRRGADDALKQQRGLPGALSAVVGARGA